MVDSYSALAAKKEAVYGTDIIPTLALNAILTRNFKDTPLKVDQLQRDLDLPSRGGTPSQPTNKRAMSSFEVEMAGSGAAGTAPRWMELLEMCGMAAPVLTATVKAEQKFAAVGTALSSGSMYRWRGNQRRKMVGARGDITAINFTAGAYPFVGLDFTGLVPAATPFDTLSPAGLDLTTWKVPVEVNTANTAFTLDGYAAVLKSFVLQANADIKLRNLVGANYVQRGNHRMTGKIVVEAPAILTKDYLATLSSGAQITTSLTHGLIAGNIVKVDSSYLQIVDISETSEDDILMWELDVQLNINTGQDDVLITAQ